jgi:integrase
MKMRRAHRVPLSRQSVDILRELKKVTGEGRWLFPSVRTSLRSISENTLNDYLDELREGQSVRIFKVSTR